MGLFEESIRWKIISFFFANYGHEQYVREIARRMGISPGSASRVCRELQKAGILKATKKGNAIFYSPDGTNLLVRRFKTDWFLERLLAHKRLWEDEEIQSVALYGSYASGEYDEKSDVDLLIITNIDEGKVRKMLGPLRRKLGVEVSLTILTLATWLGLGKKRDRFYTEVLSNHLLLFGSPLVVG